MCIVSVKPVNIEVPKEFEEYISNGCKCNSSGFGFAHKRQGESKIFMHKGIFNISELLDSIKKRDVKTEDELMVHARIPTSGKTDGENCHPFLISDNLKETVKVSPDGFYTEKSALAHNGFISGFGNSIYCDTAMFTNVVLGNKYIRELFIEDYKHFMLIFDKTIGHSKIAIMHSNPDKPIQLIGSFVEKKGMLFSNGGYQSFEARYPKTYGSGDYYGYRYDKFGRRIPRTIIDSETSYYDKWGKRRASYKTQGDDDFVINRENKNSIMLIPLQHNEFNLGTELKFGVAGCENNKLLELRNKSNSPSHNLIKFINQDKIMDNFDIVLLNDKT